MCRMILLLCLSVTAFSVALPAAAALRVRFVTFNVDFNNSTAQIDADIALVEPKADVIMFQEARDVTVDNLMGPDWTVYQVVNQGDGRRGSAIAIRNTIMTRRVAAGLVLGVDNHGEQMNDRYIAWNDIELTNGTIIRAMSLHLPPQRFEYLQPLMCDSFVAFANQSPYPVICGGDWNFTVNNDKYNVAGRTGLTERGIRIDGFYYKASTIQFDSLWELAGLGVASDHNPVQIVTDVVDTTPSSVTDWNLY